MTDYTKNSVMRISISFLNILKPDDSFIRVYPSQQLKDIALTSSSLFFKYQNIKTFATEYVDKNRILLSGPRYDEKRMCDYGNNCEMFMSLS